MRFVLILISILYSVIFLQSCNKGDDIGGPSGIDTLSQPPSVIRDSILSIDRIVQPYYESCRFNYDSKGRITSYGRFININNFDSTIINYDVTGKVTHMLNYQDHPYQEHEVRPIIFVYESGRVVKIIHKRVKKKGDYTTNYLTDISNSLEIDGYDSLIYNNTGKIIGTRFYVYDYRINPGPQVVLFSYINITYNPSNDSLYQKIESYFADVNGGNQLDWQFNFYQYHPKANPFYNKIPFYSFLAGKITIYYILTHYNSRSGHVFLADIPRLSSHNSISSNITYNFPDSMLRSSYVDAPDYGVVYYYYKKVPK